MSISCKKIANSNCYQVDFQNEDLSDSDYNEINNDEVGNIIDNDKIDDKIDEKIDAYINSRKKNKFASDNNSHGKEAAVDMDSEGSFNQNIRDMENRIRQDRIESENRIERQVELSEKRINQQYDKSLENTKASEERMEKRFGELIDYHLQSEKRINEKYDSAMQSINNQNELIDKKIDKLENKYENLKWWILGTCVATIIAVASMIYSK